MLKNSQASKDSILTRIRQANASAPLTPPVPRDYLQRDERDHSTILEEFIDRLIDYKAIVTRCTSDQLQQTIATACQQHHIAQLVVPSDIPTDWLPSTITILHDDPPLPVHTLDASDGVLTGCTLAIAQTGTIVLASGPAQGRRAISLVPDYHLCVVYAQQVVGLVPQAIQQLQAQQTQPITFISGPSATSDIELSRVEGVHGPRTLHLFIVTQS
jgi:L-lactate dehydrogenase complex protein LldG